MRLAGLWGVPNGTDQGPQGVAGVSGTRIRPECASADGPRRGVHQEPGDPARYYHGDLIDSTMLTTDDNGGVVQMAAYTAFGEYVSSSGTVGGELPSGFPRYAYAGGYGYETGLITLYGPNPDLPPITLQHVGERWYQPGIGRFIQRDPIGLLGGLNVYLYCGANPCFAVDASGLSSLLRPDAFIVLIENQIVFGGRAVVYIGGKAYVIVATRYVGDGTTEFILKNGGTISSRILPKLIDVTKTPSCIVVHNPPKGCGATGIEAAPLLIWLMVRRFRAERARPSGVRRQ